MKIYDYRRDNQDNLIRSYQAIVSNAENKDKKGSKMCSN